MPRTACSWRAAGKADRSEVTKWGRAEAPIMRFTCRMSARLTRPLEPSLISALVRPREREGESMVDELTPIATSMAHEMNVNAYEPDCLQIARLNAFDAEGCVADYFRASWWRKLFGALSPQQCTDIMVSNTEAALMIWAMKVRQDGEWDHKPKIAARFLSLSNHSHYRYTYDHVKCYYDIWSNIHYGYVGAAAGFDESVLLDGAGLEQIGSDLFRRRWPTQSAGVSGLRAYDDESDRVSISMVSSCSPWCPPTSRRASWSRPSS